MNLRFVHTAILIAGLTTASGLLTVNAANAHAASDPIHSITPSLPKQAPPPQTPEEVEEAAAEADLFPEYATFTPLALPEVDDVVAALATEGGVLVSYDIATGVESITEVNIASAAESLDAAESEGYAPPPFDESGASDVDATIVAPAAMTNLTVVNNSTSYPWSAIVKLFVINGKGESRACSGALVDAQWVLTAGHCIHDTTAGWAQRVRVVPAYAVGDKPFQYADSVRLHSFSGWTDQADLNWDIGFVRLDEPIGALTGWYGFGYNTSNSFFTQERFTNPGYPGESPYDGQKMYTREGAFDNTSAEIVYHNNRSYGGQGGAPSWRTLNKAVYAVTAFHTTQGGTGQTRMTAAKFNSLMGLIQAQTPSTVDLTPLTIQVGIATVKPGDELKQTSFLLHNYAATTWSGAVNIKVYLSTNDIISSSDLLLGVVRFQGQLAAKKSAWVPVTGLTIPSNLQSGAYWIGVQLDTADANTSNNTTMTRRVASILVVPPVQAPYYYVFVPFLNAHE